MIKFLKFTFLAFFFGILPITLIAVITFAGLKIYNESKTKYDPSGTVLNVAKVPKVEPKANVVSSLKTNQMAVNSNDLISVNNPNPAAENSDKKVELPNSVLLKVPVLMQQYNLNCEATSLAMALQYRGEKVTPQELMPKIGYAQPIKKTFKDGKMIWGDPNLGFVGNEKGFLYTKAAGLAGGTGWGVNNGPIARVANDYRPGSKEIDAANLEDLRQALAQDKPIIFWHQRDDARSEVLKYLTPEGKEIKIFQNHVNVLIGYKKDATGNFSYIFNDPIQGKITLSEKTVIREWGKYNNEIVIVN